MCFSFRLDGAGVSALVVCAAAAMTSGAIFAASGELQSSGTAVIAARSAEIPADFPTFTVAGREAQMAALRDLYWHHYNGLSPKATLWDEWLLTPTIWPAAGAESAAAAWREALSARRISPEGYVATHQHASIAHQEGWPFPFWNQGGGRGFGWHFSFHNTIGQGWRPDVIARPEEWSTTGTESLGMKEEGWALRLTQPGTVVAPPAFEGNPAEAPFVQVRWRAKDLPETAMPYLEWSTEAKPGFVEERRFYFEPARGEGISYTMVPMYKHPEWSGTVTGLRLGFDNATTGAEVMLQGVFAQYDTRHNINNPSYVSACVDHFSWTGDLNFLRREIERMRLAMRYMETEFGTDKDGLVTTPWVGHEGTTGIKRNADGSVTMLQGRGVGSNYWDLLPFGKQDAYATIRHYGAALKMAQLEEAVAKNPGWNIGISALARPAEHWREQAQRGKENGNRLFWNEETGRFTLGVDADGGQADYGFTFLNLEAVAYGFATEEHAREIMEWMCGRRVVATDTAQTSDIYKWRFAPRATTRRNVDHYGWFWNDAASIPWGGQVQDGGAVLGFSYHDLMARLTVTGAEDAAGRLEEIAEWYGEVAAEGGYRAYYDGKKRDGTMQGGGTAGGLGLDQEFFESVMVPQVMLEGFAGFRAEPAGVVMAPRVPVGWGSLRISSVGYRGHVLDVGVSAERIELVPVKKAEAGPDTIVIFTNANWTPDGGVEIAGEPVGASGMRRLIWDLSKPLVFIRKN